MDDCNNYADFIKSNIEKYHDEPFFPALFLEYAPDNIDYSYSNLSAAGIKLYNLVVDVYYSLYSGTTEETHAKKKAKLEALVEQYRHTKFLTIRKKTGEV